MRKMLTTLLRAVFGGAALLLSIGIAQAQAPGSGPGDQNVDPAAIRKQAAEVARGGPARWHQEDMTSAARMRTLRKEMGAALREAQNECRRMAGQDRADCNRDARATYRRDMAAAGGPG